ncbi:uncharacterized protein L201_005323 [Kwoniella dendrophila CBS 6074]|uniref:Uncharacterized protein n=1 Tax=Kwoniella dendrophila CBS 6074 TaxID=1295534 RepID=A0AAX4JYW9_9TREE
MFATRLISLIGVLSFIGTNMILAKDTIELPSSRWIINFGEDTVGLGKDTWTWTNGSLADTIWGFSAGTSEFKTSQYSFYFYNYKNQQNLTCELNMLRNSEDTAEYNLTSSVPFKPIVSHPEVASLICSTIPEEVYDSTKPAY